VKEIIYNLEPEGFSQIAKEILSKKYHYVDCKKNISNNSSVVGVITRLNHYIDKKILLEFPNIRMIATATTGLNHIDVEYFNNKGIKVISLKNEKKFLDSISATAEHALSMMLLIGRNTISAYNDVKEGKWRRDNFIGIEFQKKTIGIIGLGRLGKKMAKYCKALDMHVIFNDIQKQEECYEYEYVSFEELLIKSDVISIHIDYSPANHHLINMNAFNKMLKKPFLINTSRGEVICENDLLFALENKIISGAALDVIDNEVNRTSLDLKNDNLIKYAISNNNLIITPHIGGATFDSMRKTEEFIAQKIYEA